MPYRQVYRATAYLVGPKREVVQWQIGADDTAEARRLAASFMREQHPRQRYSLQVEQLCWSCKQPIRAGDQISLNRAGEVRHWSCDTARAAEDRAGYDADDFDDLSDVPF